jgi:hypothetical protein
MEPTPTSPALAWLKRNLIPLLATVLAIALAFVVGRGCESHAPATAVSSEPAPLTPKQIREADARQQARRDSAAATQRVIARLQHEVDSLKPLAAKHRATSAHLIKPLTNHEATPISPAAAALVAGPLANYRPGVYRLDSTRSIR